MNIWTSEIIRNYYAYNYYTYNSCALSTKREIYNWQCAFIARIVLIAYYVSSVFLTRSLRATSLHSCSLVRNLYSCAAKVASFIRSFTLRPPQDTQLISAKFATMFVNFYVGLYTASPQELRRARRTPDLWQVEGRLSSSSCQDRSWSCIDLNFPCMYILCKYKHSRESYLSNVIYIR